jgi:hypothetical protein
MRSFGFFLLVGSLVLTATFSSLAGPPGVTVGLLSKIIADVTHKDGSHDWSPATKGQMLQAGDGVKTGAKSMAIIKFMDNSLVRVRELSEVTVTGSVNNSTFQKTVDVKSGVVGFNIEKQKSGEEFRFSTPTSVASIRGTGGMFQTGTDGDTLIVIEGTIWLRNHGSDRSVEVGKGNTGISLKDGSLLSRLSTDEEQRRALDAMRGEASRNLEFELRNGQGRPKHLKIEYRD